MTEGPDAAASVDTDRRHLDRHSPSPLARMILRVIRGYSHRISPMLGARCRYHPTCSSFSRQAIELHGAFRGGAMGLRRIGRCHPWRAGGFDPVPGSEQLAETHSYQQFSGNSSEGITP